MTKITENKIELFAIELLEKQGFSYIYAPNIAPDSETPMRESFEDVILKEKLQNSLTVINPALDYDQIEYAVKFVNVTVDLNCKFSLENLLVPKFC